jgi:hypothetical protein
VILLSIEFEGAGDVTRHRGSAHATTIAAFARVGKSLEDPFSESVDKIWFDNVLHNQLVQGFSSK